MAEYIGSEVNRMNSLITSFLNFARPLQIHPVEADLDAVVDDVMRQQAELAKRAAGARAGAARGERLQVFVRSGFADGGACESSAECYSSERGRAGSGSAN